jgi:hypothetical protein
VALVLSLGENGVVKIWDMDGRELRVKAQRIGGRRVPPRVDLVFEDPERYFAISLAGTEKPA